MAEPVPSPGSGEARVVDAAPVGDIVELRAADGSATARIHRLGATIVSWAIAGGDAEQPAFEERLFVSPLASFEAPKAIRGGIPLCWPQFGQLGPLPAQHGFARNRVWDVAEVGPDRCTLALGADEATLAQWPFAFKLEMTVSLLPAGALHQELRVSNLGDDPLLFTAALHTYFAVSDVSGASVVGLKGCPYHDNVSGARAVDGGEAVAFPGEVDRVYMGAPDTLKLADAGRNSVLMIHKHGFADAVVWNPAEGKAAAMADLGADNWRGFVCVEVAQARSGAVTLAPGGTWAASQTLEYDTLGES